MTSFRACGSKGLAIFGILAISWTSTALASETSTPINVKIIPVTPLAQSESGQFAAATQAAILLPLPSGDIAGFGAAVAAYDGMTSSYVVVGAPDADAGKGRVFVYKKAHSSASFGAPTELCPLAPQACPNGRAALQPGDRYGASVAIRWGTIAVGVRSTPLGAYMFSQERDANGTPVDSGAFAVDPGPFLLNVEYPAVGKFIALSPDVEGQMLVCDGALCSLFYRFAFPAGTTPHWSPAYAWANTNSGSLGRLPGSSSNSLALHGTDGLLRIYNPTPRLSAIPNNTFSPPIGGGSFSGNPVGSESLFLAGVSVPSATTTRSTRTSTEARPPSIGFNKAPS